ncbi:MAG: hypothetical protein Q7T71_17685 [Herbiconiux sp.]|nr:hypothetical protein [Herbiconiux sp.]
MEHVKHSMAALSLCSALLLSGCTINLPDADHAMEAATQTPSPSESDSSFHRAEADKPACEAFSAAMKPMLDDTLTADSSVDQFVAVYKQLAYDVTDAANFAPSGLALETSMLDLASVAARASDTLTATGGLSTEDDVEIRAAISAVGRECKVTYRFE